MRRLTCMWVLGAAFALTMTGCGKQEPAEPQEPVVDDVAEPAGEPAAPTPKFDQDFIDHMHAHAEQLDELMFALADGDLDGAMTPAYWLSRHDAVTGVPDEWQQYISGMREAAIAVGKATDLEAAQVAAERISLRCQDCHAAAGITALQ